MSNKLLAIGILLMLGCFMLIGGEQNEDKTVNIKVKTGGIKQEYIPVIPEPYYNRSDRILDHTPDGLRAFVGVGFIQQYEINRFDCGEMASYLEWKLEKYNYNASICVDHGKRHAWTAVDLPRGRYYIETTAHDMQVVSKNDVRYDYYNDYEHIYADIYELMREESFSEFDWWNSKINL